MDADGSSGLGRVRIKLQRMRTSLPDGCDPLNETTEWLPDEMYGKAMSIPDSALLNFATLVTRYGPQQIADLEREFKTDFEVYGPRFFEDGLHEVLVHIGIRG